MFEKGQLITTAFLSLKNDLDIITSSSTLLKLLIVFPMTLCGKPAFKNFALILVVSDWKSEKIFLALCNLPLFAFFLYQSGTFEENAVTSIDEHEQPDSKLEPSEHLKNNPGHRFDWMM